MRQIRIISALALVLAGHAVWGQDVRTLDTKIADLLVQMPVNDLDHRDRLAEETFQLGEDGLSEICSLIVPPGKGDDTRARFAIESLSRYLSKEAPSVRSEAWEKVCLKLATGGSDPHVQSFFMSQLQWIGGRATAEALAPYLVDDFLCSPAISAMKLADPVRAGEIFTSEIGSLSGIPEIETVKALGELQVTDAAGILAEMAAGENSTDLNRTLFWALALIGNPESVKTLQRAAKSVKYLPEPTGATGSLLEFARELGQNGNTRQSNEICLTLIKRCKSGSQVHFKSSALQVYADNVGMDAALPLLIRAMGDGSKAYRMAGIQYAIEMKSPAGPWIRELEKNKNTEVQSEILYLLSSLKDPSAKPAVVKAMDHPDGAVRAEAVLALASIEGSGATGRILAHLLKYPTAPDLGAASLALQTTAKMEDMKTLAGSLPGAEDQVKIALLEILAAKGSNEFFGVLLEYTGNENPEVGFSAVRGLKNVVTGEDLEILLDLLARIQDPEWKGEVQQAIISSVNEAGDKKAHIQRVLTSMKNSSDEIDYIPILSGVGGEASLKTVKQTYDNSQGETRELALQSLINWSDGTAIPHLYDVCRNTGSVPAFNGYVRQVAQSGHTTDHKLLLLRKILPLAADEDQKKWVINACSNIKTFLSFMFVSQFMDDPQLRQPAVNAVVQIALPSPGQDDGLYGDKVREILSSAKELITGPESPYIKIDIETYLKNMPEDPGFVSIFNGRDLSGWQGLVENPITRAKMKEEALEGKQAEADELMLQNWTVENGWLVYKGNGYDNICSVKEYSDFELLLDWKIKKNGDSGLYLRGTPQVQIWDPSRDDGGTLVGSGGLFNNQENESKPLQLADNPVGDWNTFRITMMGERVSVYLNGILVVDNEILENYWDRTMPVFPSGPIELQAHDNEVTFRDIYVREIQGAELSPEEKADGFVLLFNGKNLDGWIGNKVNHVVEEGTIAIRPDLGGKGNLYTEKEYANFNLRLEFKLTPGANNGLGIRTPPEGDAAYVGMEFQVLDNTAEVYANLKPYQYHGSVYGVIPARRGFLEPVGEWNEQEVIVDGTKIKIILNGTVIVDGDIADSIRNGTMDGRDHPGLKRKSGHIGFLGHGSVLWYRNIRIKELVDGG